MNFTQNGFFHGATIQNPINEEPQIKKNVDEIRNILNDFMEPDDRSDVVDEGTIGSNQYLDDLFTEIEFEFY